MHALLETVLETSEFVNGKNEKISINSHTRRAQCEFLQKIILDNKFSKSLEIGFAYGTSTLAIVDAVSKNGGRHFVIDKFQYTDWSGNGLDLINQAGYSDLLDFNENFCYEALPKLLSDGRKFDFAYIDSTKQFDWILVDFFYIDKLLEKNGVIVFDDVTFPGIRKVLRYISQFPNYKIYAQYPQNVPLKAGRKAASLLQYLPKAKKILKEELITSDFELGINTHCVALQKIDDDKRNWDWHKDF